MDNIFQIHQGIRDLLDKIDPETGELGVDILEEYSALQNDLNDKQKNTLLYWKYLDSQKTQIESEIARLKFLKGAKERQMDSVEKLVRYTMDNCGARKLDFGTCKATYRSASSVVIDETVPLPKEFQRVITATAPDKTLLKQALEGGREIPGVRLETYDSLSIN